VNEPTALAEIQQDSDEPEPPPITLEGLFSRLGDFESRARISVELCGYDNSLLVCLMSPGPNAGWCQAFRVYSDFHVGDNRKFIERQRGLSGLYWEIRERLEKEGARHFHNPYMDFIDRRFREYIKNRMIED
jgi:hypothetical protein